VRDAQQCRLYGILLERAPDTATADDLRRFRLHMVDQGASPITINATLTGLKFFFEITLSRGELLAKVQPMRVPQTVPVVLSQDGRCQIHRDLAGGQDWIDCCRRRPTQRRPNGCCTLSLRCGHCIRWEAFPKSGAAGHAFSSFGTRSACPPDGRP